MILLRHRRDSRIVAGLVLKGGETMKRHIIAACVTACLALAGYLATAPATFGHHSVSGQFDPSMKITVKGVITKVNWVNPHIYVLLDATDEKGNVVPWQFETAPPAFMRKAGLTSKKLIGDGQPVTIVGYPARDTSKQLGWILKITYADGHFYELSPDRN